MAVDYLFIVRHIYCFYILLQFGRHSDSETWCPNGLSSQLPADIHLNGKYCSNSTFDKDIIHHVNGSVDIAASLLRLHHAALWSCMSDSVPYRPRSTRSIRAVFVAIGDLW